MLKLSLLSLCLATVPALVASKQCNPAVFGKNFHVVLASNNERVWTYGDCLQGTGCQRGTLILDDIKSESTLKTWTLGPAAKSSKPPYEISNTLQSDNACLLSKTKSGALTGASCKPVANEEWTIACNSCSTKKSKKGTPLGSGCTITSSKYKQCVGTDGRAHVIELEDCHAVLTTQKFNIIQVKA
ncbi:hypothetical protein RQP46_010361 [Phenoliferia psychrophenolica]